MEKEIEKILNEVNIDKARKGYYLLVELISKIYMDYSKNNFYEFKIGEYYVKVSKKHKANYASVERCIRYVIKNQIDDIRKYFSYYEKKINNKKFVILALEKLYQNGNYKFT